MAKYTSGRQRNLKVGISSYSENTQVVSVIGRVGIGSTVFNADYDLDVRGTVKFSGDIILGNSSSNLINVPGRISSNFYPDGDGTYDVGRGPQIGSGANRWKDANFLGIGKFDGGVDAHDLELGVSSANLIYSTSGNLELNSQSGTTNIDDILTISGNTGIGTVNPQQKLWVEGNGYFSGILTAQRLYSSLYGEFTGGSISGTSIVGTSLSISGISTFSDGPVFIGSTTSTGTASQPLQVTGGAYVSGNLGIGVTNPITELTINGRISAGNSISSQSIENVINQNVGTGYSAARSFNLVDTSSVIKIVRNNDSFGPIVEFQHWNVGITSLISYWDISSEQGTFSIRDRIGNYDQTKQQLTRIFINEYGNVLLGASNQAIGPNKIQSVGYGTANILQVNGGAYVSGSVGIGTTNPTSKLWVDGGGYFTGVVTATTFIGNLSGTATTATNLSNAANITTGTIDKDRLLNSNSFSVLGDLYVSNNISFGGTTTQLNLQQLQIVDADIVLGIGTSFSPTDNTANHGGIAIASTEGTPLVDLNIIPQETNPSTYKKIMWFKGDTIGAGLTDAWLFNYAVGIGTTQVPNGVRLAVGGLKVTDTTISTPNLNVTGVGTFLSSGLKIRNPANTFGYTIAGDAIAADYTLTLPVVTSNTGIAVTGLSQTFSASQTFSGQITATDTLNLSGRAAGSSHVFGSIQTTSTLTLGGASGTGTITLGRATTSQQTDIQAGITASGNTKTINLGTGGASGSFTQINIGPTAGVGTVVINSGNNLVIGSLTPTSALTVVGNVLVSGISTLGVTTTTNLTAQQLNVSGITTVGFLTATNISVSGIVTSNAYYIGTTQVISSARQLQNIASLDATTTATIETAIQQAPNDFTSLNISGISTLQSTTLIGGGTSTGTAGQVLQVTGISSGAYIGGDLGIGTTNPGEKLQVDGNIRVGISTTSNYIAFRGTTGDSPGSYNHTYIGERIWSTGTERSELLLFKGNDIDVANGWDRIRLAASQVRIDTYTTATNGTFEGVGISTTLINRVVVHSTGEVGIGTDVLTGTASQRLQVNSGAYVSGNLGVGNTNPQNTLDVGVGTIRLINKSSTGRFSQIYQDNELIFSNSSTNDDFSWINSSGSRMRLYGAGNLVIPGTFTPTGTASQRLQVDGGAHVSGSVGIGTTNPTSKLHVVGDTYISGILTATDINSASDIRLKTNIKPFENTLEKIVHINGVSFNWIDGNAKSGGIIAQDVEKVFPELVNDGDHKTVNYNGLIGVLVESIKELKQEIEDLKSRLGEI